MYYIIFDIEATCWQNKSNNTANECIEIGAVKLSNDGSIIDTFQSFIKPLNHPCLSAFCKQLTHINQADIDGAPSFERGYKNFMHWIGIESDYVMASWGYFDLNVLAQDCHNTGVNPQGLRQYVNLRHQYHHIKKIKGRIGIHKVFEMETLEMDLPLHRALSDAQNLVKLFNKMKQSWSFDSYNSNDLYFLSKKKK